MSADKIGITYNSPPPGVESVGVYEDEDIGVEVEIVDGPYLASDGKTLFDPLYVKEADETYRASDGVLYDSLPIRGGVAPVPSLKYSGILSVNEDTAIGSVLGVFTVSNPSGSYVLSITNDPDSKFTLVENELRLAASLDYEAKTSHEFTVEASNGVDAPLSYSNTLEVINVVEGTLGPSTASFDLSLPPGTVITTITGLDVGASEIVTSVTPNDGRIAFNDTQLLIGSSASSVGPYTISVGTSAGRTLSMEITVTAAPSYSWSNIGALFNDGAIDGLMIDFMDTTTLFQDGNGALPITAASQPVGLALDQHKWGGKTLAEYRASQPELITNPDFVSDVSGWSVTANGTITWAAGKLRLTTNSGSPYFYQSFSTIVGRWYEATVVFSGISGTGNMSLYIGTSPGNATNYSGPGAITAPGTYRRWFKATATTTFISMQNLSGIAFSDWESVSVKEIDGHHATSSLTARPTWNGIDVTFDGSNDNMNSVDYYFQSNGNFLAMWGAFGSSINNCTPLGSALNSSPLRRGYLQIQASGAVIAALGSSESSPAGNVLSSMSSILAQQNETQGDVYINGIPVGLLTSPGPLPDSSYSLQQVLIGARNNNGASAGYLDGRVRRVVCGHIRLTDVMSALDFHKNLIDIQGEPFTSYEEFESHITELASGTVGMAGATSPGDLLIHMSSSPSGLMYGSSWNDKFTADSRVGRVLQHAFPSEAMFSVNISLSLKVLITVVALGSMSGYTAKTRNGYTSKAWASTFTAHGVTRLLYWDPMENRAMQINPYSMAGPEEYYKS